MCCEKSSSNMWSFNENRGLLKLLHVAVVVGGLVLTPCQTCSLQDGKTTTMEERLAQFDIVVYGKDVQHVVRKGTVVDFTDSVLEVYCTMKGDANVTGNITIEEILPKTPCSGTYIYYLQKLDGNYSPGLEIIIGLTRVENGNYLWQEVNQLETSAFEPTTENWNHVANVLPASNWINGGNPDTGCPRRFYPNAAQGQQITERNDSKKSSIDPEVNMSSLSYSTIKSHAQITTEVHSQVSTEVHSQVSTEVHTQVSTEVHSTEAKADTSTRLSTKSAGPGVKDDEIKIGELGSPNNAANCLSFSLFTVTMSLYL